MLNRKDTPAFLEHGNILKRALPAYDHPGVGHPCTQHTVHLAGSFELALGKVGEPDSDGATAGLAGHFQPAGKGT